MKRSLFSLLILSTSCDSPETAGDRAAAASTSPDGIECALAGADRFERHCRLERGAGDALTVHHPDGGFRRLSGGGTPADGADRGRARALPDGRLEWAIDRDRYRLPAQ